MYQEILRVEGQAKPPLHPPVSWVLSVKEKDILHILQMKNIFKVTDFHGLP